MAGEHNAVLSRIKTVADMVDAFRDEEQCRRLLEQMVWSRGRICPACSATIWMRKSGNLDENFLAAM